MTRRKWQDLNHKSTPDQIEEARRQLDRELTLSEVRKAREMTQTQLARTLEMTQPAISAMEHRADLYVSSQPWRFPPDSR